MVNMSVFCVWHVQLCMYSIIWLTRSLIRPQKVCGGFFGPLATMLNLVLILGPDGAVCFGEGEQSAEECFVLDTGML